LLSTILFIKIVGIIEYGKYSILLAQCNLLSALGFGWINHSILRYCNSEKAQELEINTIKNGWIYSSIIIFILTIFFSRLQNFSPIEIIFCIFCTILIALYSLIKIQYQASIQPKAFINITALQSLLLIIIPLILLYFDQSLNMLLLGIVIAYSIVIIFKMILKKSSNINSPINKSNDNKIKKWISFGIPISLWFTFSLAFPYIERIFIKNYLSLEALGMYSSLQELLIRSYSLILFPITMALHPRIMKSWNNNKKYDSIKLIKGGVLIFFIVFLLIISPILFFKEYFYKILQLILPDISTNFLRLVPPLMITGFLWQLSLLTHKLIELKEKSKLMAIMIFISLIMSIISNYLFIPIYGIIATAYSSMFSALFYCLLTSIYSIQSLKLID
jgi:O-antigen/teichoic acid export membrane protein